MPVYPSIGNHDAEETEERDDRAQVEDNFYLRERILSEEAAGRASFCPGLFYRFRYGSDIEFVCLDTSKEAFFRGKRLFEYPKHWEFVEQSFPEDRTGMLWRIPFAHHPPYCAGPQHHNTKSMQRLIPLFERSGVKVMFSGHEHNFQHSHADGIDYFVTGAAGKLRRTPPDSFESAHTVTWATDCHFLLARIEGTRMSVRAIGDIDTPDEQPADITRSRSGGEPARRADRDRSRLKEALASFLLRGTGGGECFMAIPEQKSASDLSQQAIALAEQLGRIAGTIEGTAEAWLTRQKLTDQLTRVRDGATQMLDTLTNGAEKGRRRSRTASDAITAVGIGRAAQEKPEKEDSEGCGRAAARGADPAHAPGKKRRKPAPTMVGVKKSDERIPKMRTAAAARQRRKSYA